MFYRVNNSNQEFVEVSEEPIHKELFKNEYIRAYLATMYPGEETQYHRHSIDTIYVVLEGGIISTNTLRKENISSVKLPKSFNLYEKLKLGIKNKFFGSMKLPKAFFFIMYHKETPVVHKAIASAKNQNDMKLLGIELIRSENNSKIMSLKNKYMQIDFMTSEIIIYRLNLKPGKSTGYMNCDFSGVLVAIEGEAYGAFANESYELSNGDIYWFNKGTVQNFLNLNKSQKCFHAIIIAIKG